MAEIGWGHSGFTERRHLVFTNYTVGWSLKGIHCFSSHFRCTFPKLWPGSWAGTCLSSWGLQSLSFYSLLPLLQSSSFYSLFHIFYATLSFNHVFSFTSRGSRVWWVSIQPTLPIIEGLILFNLYTTWCFLLS